MIDQTKTELVDAVEDAIKRAGEEWSYPCVIERLREWAERRAWADSLGMYEGTIMRGDVPMLRGLADALEEAIR